MVVSSNRNPHAEQGLRPTNSGETPLVAVKIKLKRLGKMRQAQYRIVIADSRTKRDGRAIEEIGLYHPKEEPSTIVVNSERAQYWLSVGAQPTEPVLVLLKITGDWQKFKGLPGTEGTLRVADVKPNKRDVFEAITKESADEPRAEAVTPKKKAAKAPEVVDAPAAEAPVDDAPVADAPVADAPAAAPAAVEAPVTEAVADVAADAATESTEA